MKHIESQDGSKQTIQPVDSNGERHRKRRRGREAHELAAFAQCSVHKARMALEVMKYAPELCDPILRGKGSLSDAVRLIRTFRPIKRRREETTFAEEESGQCPMT